ncbi:MAG: hypothetical protein QGF59_07165 [Pirellulaceae bacterium]|jgi:hypothetical protein|nr:hypothetical protein [Pirellulaceae bacterium]
MCGVAEASLAMSVVSGVMQAYGQQQAAKQAQAEANFRAALAENNRIRGEQLAEDALRRGKEAEREERIRGNLLLGQMQAVLGSSNVEVNEGSAGDLVIDQAEINELDALTVRTNAEREAQEFRFQAAAAGSEAALFRFSGENARRSGTFAAAGTLLSTAGTVAQRWYGFKKDGIKPFGI